jgi:hypothetical protein
MPSLQDADYEDDFETSNSAPTWISLDYADVTVEEKISGGGVGLVHRGKIGKQRVALKTLVSFEGLAVSPTCKALSRGCVSASID